MLTSVAASAAAARALNYPGLAELIERDRLGPHQIAALARLSCCKTAARDYALIILAGSLGRYRVAPADWSGQEERDLALTMLVAEEHPQAKMFELGKKASRIIPKGWKG
ncbi:MAG: hypothetical protein WBW08_10980 [Methyloceanibacter sp.]|jgi:hypothetical protein